MTPQDETALRRENDYLKRRCAQLQDDVTSLSSQVSRLEQQLEARLARRAAHVPDPLGGGQ